MEVLLKSISVGASVAKEALTPTGRKVWLKSTLEMTLALGPGSMEEVVEAREVLAEEAEECVLARIAGLQKKIEEEG